jgi:hypothetical protein
MLRRRVRLRSEPRVTGRRDGIGGPGPAAGSAAGGLGARSGGVSMRRGERASVPVRRDWHHVPGSRSPAGPAAGPRRHGSSQLEVGPGTIAFSTPSAAAQCVPVLLLHSHGWVPPVTVTGTPTFKLFESESQAQTWPVRISVPAGSGSVLGCSTQADRHGGWQAGIGTLVSCTTRVDRFATKGHCQRLHIFIIPTSQTAKTGVALSSSESAPCRVRTVGAAGAGGPLASHSGDSDVDSAAAATVLCPSASRGFASTHMRLIKRPLEFACTPCTRMRGLARAPAL